MKKNFSKCFLTLTLAAIALPATAGSVGRRITVHVPFPFMAGSSRMSAGDYSVSQDDTQNVVYLMNRNTRSSVILLPEANTWTGNAAPSVNFLKVGNEYYMKNVRTAMGTGFSMRTSH